MFADDWGQQPTLDTFGDETPKRDVVRAAAEARNDLAELGVKAHVDLARAEQALDEGPAYTPAEWLALDVDEQIERIPERISALADAAEAHRDRAMSEADVIDLVDEHLDRRAEYPGQRPEDDATGREFQ